MIAEASEVSARISEDLRWYQDSLPKVAATVDAHWAMAEACKQRGLSTQREHHLQEILKLDPEALCRQQSECKC